MLDVAGAVVVEEEVLEVELLDVVGAVVVEEEVLDVVEVDAAVPV